LIDDSSTDKNTVHSYLDVYQELFESKKYTAKNVLEIGIFEGGSIKLWDEFFVNATIYGVDIEDRIKLDIKNEETIKLYPTSDAYSENFVTSTFLDKDIKFDVIIDDGPHSLESMVYCIQLYLPLLSDNGILVIEDVPQLLWIDFLTITVPDELKKYIKSYDLRHNKDRFDDILFTVQKNSLQ
jgi:cephalosporin hydroxylase